MINRIVLHPYDAFELATFVVHGDLVYIGHFGGMFDDQGRKLHTIQEQTVQTFRNLERALAEIDLLLDDLLKVTVTLKNISDFQGMHEGWKQVFSADYPTRMTVTSDFIDEECLIQIDGVAGIA